MKMKLIRGKRWSRSSSSASKFANSKQLGSLSGGDHINGEIKWELRPGGMLVQKREYCGDDDYQRMITIRVSTGSYLHHIPILPTSTFGEMKILLSLLTNLEPKAQRLLFKGKEREDHEHLHMVGVGDNDKLLMLEDPAIKETKLLGSTPPRSPLDIIRLLFFSKIST